MLVLIEILFLFSGFAFVYMPRLALISSFSFYQDIGYCSKRFKNDGFTTPKWDQNYLNLAKISVYKSTFQAWKKYLQNLFDRAKIQIFTWVSTGGKRCEFYHCRISRAFGLLIFFLA